MITYLRAVDVIEFLQAAEADIESDIQVNIETAIEYGMFDGDCISSSDEIWVDGIHVNSLHDL